MPDHQLVYDRLVDDESRIYFDARKSHLTDPSLTRFYSIIRKAGISYRFRELPQPGCRGFVLWGETDDRFAYHTLLLQDAGYRVAGADTSPEECSRLVHDCGYAVMVPREFRDTVPRQIPEDKIICLEDHLVGRCGWQYFDYFKPQPGECFLDGGALDGNTTVQFIEWCGGQYESIYAFEPNPLQIELCRDNLRQIGDPSIRFFDQALWDQDETLSFEAYPQSKWGAHISGSGQYSVPAVAADPLLRDQKITFIKLDVEGAELQALKGAEQIILKNRPRMAVSIYHNPEDFINIPLYLLSLVSDYRFAIRHYHSDQIETLLYVF